MGTVIAPSGPWSMGTWTWLPICAVLILICVAVIRSLLRYRSRENVTGADRTEVNVVVGLLSAVAVLLAVGTLVFMWPYDSEFHQWRSVTGKVEAVNDRLVPAGKGMQQRFVLVIDGQPFAVDDTRAALVKVGDDVTLSCKREWEYASLPGWACRWGGV